MELTFDVYAKIGRPVAEVFAAVVMTFERLDDGGTLVRILEHGWHADAQGLKDSYQNCSGWTQMLCCLKAWAEHGIHLRRGFF